tara:strand:- start:1580 stop:4183 length:2604 start_codon:yes stop_codon:yes gene_type:complete
MSKLGINTGSTPNDGTGDNLLSGAIKINSNFDELYTALGDGTTLGTPVTSIVAGTNVSVSSSTGDVTINATGGGSGSINGITIKEEGVAVGTATSITSINFVGADVTATGTGQDATITISSSGGGGGSGGIDVQDEGVALATTATTLNFVGDGVVASGTGVTKTITIAGGGGSGVGGTWTTYDSNTGVTTTKKVKIQNDLEVTGFVTATSGLRIPGGTFSNNRLELGNSQEFSFQYNTASTKGIVRVLSQDLDIEGKNIGLYPNNGENGVIANQNGAVELYYDNVKKFETTGTGATVYGTTQSQQLNVSGLSTFTGDVSLGSSISLGDGKAIMLGAGHDLQILHTGSHSVIKDVGTGNLNVNASRLLITNSDGSEYLGKFDQDGGVELYYDNNKKLETATDGVNVTGGLTVTGEVTGGRIKVVGIVTATNAIIGAGSSTDGVETPMMTLTHNNPTVVGTSGTTGQFKQIGGAPFFYDGAVWREFVLATGTPVTRREDSDWDNVMLRLDFEDDTTNVGEIENKKVVGAGLDQSPDNVETNNVDLVGSPVKYGSKALRLSGAAGNFPFAWTNRETNTNDSLFDFTGGWTIETWLYMTSLPSSTSGNIAPIITETELDNTPEHDWGIFLQYNAGTTYVFRWYNNNNGDSYTSAAPGTIIGSMDSTNLLNQWNHIALVRDPSDSSMHFYINGTETVQTNGSSSTLTDANLSWGGTSSYLSFGYHYKILNTNDHYASMVIDDVRISKSARYTSNFTAPTSALPIAGTASTIYTPPGSKQGEIALGTSPTWTGMSGVTASRIGAGHYRATFSSSFTNSSDYVITTSMNDHIPSTTAVGIGVTRYTSYADFIVTRVSDSVGIDSGSLAINLMKK